MLRTGNKQAAIKAISTHFPFGTLTNDDLEQEYEGKWNSQDILKKTGINVRYISDQSECASDLGIAAAQKLFANGSCHPDDIDFLLFCTQSPDYFLPTTACLIHEKLGLRKDCGALDFNQGCSGFIYGLSLAKGLIETGVAKNILLITAETYSKYINNRDKSTRTIFGDGAAATLISEVESDSELIGPFVFGTDGRGASNLIVPAGCSRIKKDRESIVEIQDENGNFRSQENIYMNGPEIFNFTLKAVPTVVRQMIDRWGGTFEEIDYFVFHQANKFMLETLRKKINIPQEKFWIGMENGGNTVSSTIPIAMETALQQGVIKPETNIMLVGFGVGYSWGATIIKVPNFK